LRWQDEPTQTCTISISDSLHNLVVKEVNDGVRADREYLFADCDANAILALTHTEGATKLYLVGKLALRDDLLEALYYLTATLDVAG
jgi:hypothetical protein